MDSSHYPSHGINTTSAPQTYPSPTAISLNQVQTDSTLPQTVPPLQPMDGSHPHTPRTAGNNTPNRTGNVPPYQDMSRPASRPGIYPMGQDPYPPYPGYATSAAVMPQTATAAFHPQPTATASAPPPAGGRGPPVLLPMPPGGLVPQAGQPSPYGPGSLTQPNPFLQEGNQPTRVVGSQGRRGILPSASGRPAAPPAGTTAAKSTVITVKDSDGKFPCPHCTKTYLHTKHLKRHLLRHTGDRPYICVLCRDTFSRSDILKRHFQKCSIRRGNPTGASHLSHPQAHVKKNAQAQKAAGLANEGDMNHLNGLNNMPQADGMVHPFGMVPVQDGMNNMAGDQNQLSRSNSMNRLENGAPQDRRNMPGMNNSQPYGADPNSMNQQQMPQYGVPHGQNGMPMYGGSNANQQSGLDWSQMFQAGAHQTLNEHPFHPPNRGQTQIGTKTGPNSSMGTTGCSSSDAVVYSEWGIPSSVENPYTQLSNQILNFFYPPNEAIDPHLTGMNLHLSPENVDNFIGHFDKFHQHAPLLHKPSFRIMDAHIGLVTCMCCIGACYSDRLEPSVVREMMDNLWISMERDCLGAMPTSYSVDSGDEGASTADVQVLQALVLMSALHVWNGTSQQRTRARKAFPQVASQARRLGLLHHHGPGKPVQDWPAWADSEQRLRLMHGIIMCDTVWALYCNIPPQFEPFEVQLPLPCDEALWSARTESDWASITRTRQSPSSLHGDQPEFDLALRTLLHPLYRISKGSTSTGGKWVLLFAVMALTWRAQRGGFWGNLHQDDPLPSRVWIMEHGGVKMETDPVNGQCLDPQSYLVLSGALDKVKSILDEDAPSTSAAGQGPEGCIHTDTILSYWIAKRLLTYKLPDDPELSEEACFMRVLQLMDGIRAWVVNNGEAKGEKLELVGEIKEHEDSTLNMTDFFGNAPRGAGDTGAAPATN